MVYCKIVIHLFFNGPAIPFNSVQYPIINFSKQSVTTFHFIELPRNNIHQVLGSCVFWARKFCAPTKNAPMKSQMV